MGEVLQHALVRQPQPIKWEEDTNAVVAPAAALATTEETGVIAH
jgi:hypothetical protein